MNDLLPFKCHSGKIRLLILLIPFLFQYNTIYAQQIKITGVVHSETGEPLPGATVLVKGTSNGVSTDAKGNYSIAATIGDSLLFRYLGYVEDVISVGTKPVVNITLQPNPSRLQDVVVVGYGTAKRKDITGAISSVNSEQINQVPSVNAAKSIQGMVPGVDIMDNNNDPGAAPTIRIRGNRSITAGNDPLLVVDGVPFEGNLNDLNSGDIKSIDVLKDASATAIYGSRGANGVILVTTKRGQYGKSQVSYNGYYGIQTSLRKPKLMDGAEFAEFRREAERNVGKYPSADPVLALDEAMWYNPSDDLNESIAQAYDTQGHYDPSKVRWYDFIKELTQKGNIQEHQLNFSSGNEKTKVAISGEYFKNQGIVKGFNYKRYNLRFTIDNQLNRFLKIGGTAATSINVNNSNSNLYAQATQMNPLAPIYDSTGQPIAHPGNEPLYLNPVLTLEYNKSKSNSKRFYGNVYLEATIFDGLSYKLTFGPDYRTSTNGYFSHAGKVDGDIAYAGYTTNERFHYILDNMITFNRTISHDHQIGITLVQSTEKDRYQSISGSASDFPYDEQLWYNLGSANTISGLSSGLSEWALSSFMGRFNYSYQDKYLLTFTGRYDGSSRLAQGNKWSFFPSVAVAWNMKKETFLKNSLTVSSLKLRASYGETGNTAISPYQTLGSLGRTSYDFGGNAAFGYEPNLIYNPSLGWEKTTQLDIGIDFSLLKDRIYGAIDYYIENTSDLLLARQLPQASGFASILQNIGATRNKGIEIGVSGKVINNQNFKWTADVVFTKNNERIVKLYNNISEDIGNGWFVGHPINSFYDYKKIGIFQNSKEDKDLMAKYNAQGTQFSPGDIKIADINADGRINADDRTILGSGVPKWSGSLNNRFSYKNIDFSILLFAREGFTISDSRGIQYEGRYNWLNVDYWTPENPTNAYPKPVAGQTTPPYASTLQYQDGSFVRIRNITIGYTLPNALTDKSKISQLRFYLSALNPFLFTKYDGIDPEGSTGIETPSVRTIMGGVNLTF